MATILLQIEADPSGLAPAAESIKQIGKLTDDLYQKLVDAGDGFKQMAAAAKVSATDAASAQGKLNQSVSQFSSSMQSITKTVSVNVFKQVSTEMTEFATSVNGAVSSVQSLQTQQTEIVTVMEEMVTMSQQTTEAYAQLEVALENNKQAIGASAGAFAEMDWDTGILEDTYSMLGYLSEGFKNVDGIAQEFGINSQELQDIISGLEITMAAVNLLMAEQGIIQKANAAATAFANAQIKAQEIFMKMNAVATSIATGIFNLFGVSVNVTSNAFKILKAAIVSTGIGALVVGIGAVVAGIMMWADESENAAKAEDRKAAAAKNALAAMERENKLLEEHNNKLLSQAENQLKIAKAKGDKNAIREAEDLVFKVNKESLEYEMQKLKQDIDKLKPEGVEIPADLNEGNIEGAIKNVNNQLSLLEDKKIEVDLGDNEAEKKKLDAKIDSYKTFLSKLYALSGKQGELGDVVNNQAANDIKRNTEDNEEKEKNDKKYHDSRKKKLEGQMKDDENKYKKLLLTTKEGSKDSLDATIDFLTKESKFYQDHWNKLDMAASEKDLKIAENTKKIEDAKLAYAKKVYDDKLAHHNKSVDLALLSVEEGSKDEYILRADALMKENKLIDDFAAQNGKLDDDMILRKAQNQKAIDDLNKQALQKGWDAAQEEIRVLDLVSDLKRIYGKEEADLKAQYAALEAKGYNGTYESFLKEEKNKLDAAASFAKKKLDTEKAWLDTGLVSKQQIEDDYQQWLKTHKEGEFDDFVAIEQKKIDELKKKADEKKALEQELNNAGIELASQAASTMMDIANTQRQAAFDNQMSQLQKEKEAELSNKKLTEAQKEAINKKYADKEKALKRKKFEDDKKAKIAEAVINAALGVTKLAATSPPPDPRFFIGLGMIAATTAMQIAKIATTPVPQFAKGTRNAPPGFKWVGEQGPELINTPGGHAIITATDSNQLSAIFDKYGLPGLQVPQFKAASVSNMLSYQSDKTGGSAIDYDEMGRSIARHLPEGTKVNINMDKDGVHAYVTRSNSRVNYNNNKFRFN